MILHKFLVLVSTRCVDSGDISDSPKLELFDSQPEALERLKTLQSTSRALINREIAKIGNLENRLIFNSPYISNAALFKVPGSVATAEDAEVWISEQLAEGEDLSEHVLWFEGFSIGSKGETATSLEAFFDGWG